MDFKTPTKKSAIETATMIGGVTGGAMVSKGVFSLIHDPLTDVPVGTDWKKIGKRAGAIAVGAGISAFVKAEDTLSTVIKGFGIGMAAMQTAELVADLSSKSPKVAALTTGSKAEKFLAKTLGLACPDEMSFSALQGSRRRSRRGMYGAMDGQTQIGEFPQPQVQTLDAIFAGV